MENLLYRLKGDIQYLIKLEKEISVLSERLLFISNLKDKKNYNEDRANKCSIKIKELSDISWEIKTKWGI